MRIIGIDQSYTSTGFTIFENDIVIDYGLIRSDPKQDTFDRARQLANDLAALSLVHNPHAIGLEGLAFGMRGDATRNLAGLQYLIIDRLRDSNNKVFIIAPNSVKKVATGKGNAKKEELYAALPQDVKDKFIKTGAKKTTGLFDLTDAYFIGKATILEVNKIIEQNKKVVILEPNKKK